MFLRFVLLAMMFSVIFARNLELNDDHEASQGVPCSQKEASMNITHHHRREIPQTTALKDNNSAPSMIISAKNDDEQPHPLKMHLKKRAATYHESHTPGPKPGCCG